MGANYSADLQRTASTSQTVGGFNADATTPRRQKLYDLIVGSEASPADNVFLWTVRRYTVAGTSTAVVPGAIDPADALALADAGENHTAEPTYIGIPLISIPLNQRATFRWVANPGSELVVPATASNGLGLETPVSSAVLVTAQIMFEEQ